MPFLMLLPLFLILYFRYKRNCEEIANEYEKVKEENKQLRKEIDELRRNVNH